ncbi:hypothetical protein HWC35_gp137 [Vibrio phage USC-1]|uniref:Uncharacterized protein n=2 Tax=Aphroditevirus USC1 TaxID=2846605 RepID=A0A514A2P3_9CAUD|nr:hypothetical protein HWC35_gp137 [Vibrio phage USC-1]QCW23198.1 hypothetical protein [Vibrio phage 5 TSL-2019]QDH47531.1 hypothetical protein [Vibrio phage USC-1]
MYVVNTGRIMENLLTFDKMGFDNFTIHGYVHALLEDVVEVFNSKDFDQAYDRIGHLTTLLGNNTAVETIYIEQLEGIRKYARASGWDSRLKIKICEEKNVKNRDGIIHQVLLIMDLDATVEELSFAPESPVSLGELVSDNPSQDELSKLVQ